MGLTNCLKSSVELPSGRKIYLDYLTIQGTYKGFLEGSYETANKQILERQNLKRRTSDNAPLCTQVIKPADIAKRKNKPLPGILFHGRFSSHPLVDDPRLDDESLMLITWFQDELEPIINEESKRLFGEQIQWEKYAVDCPMF